MGRFEVWKSIALISEKLEGVKSDEGFQVLDAQKAFSCRSISTRRMPGLTGNSKYSISVFCRGFFLISNDMMPLSII
jgi:hypothetical protein